MTREQIYTECITKLSNSNTLLLQLPTGFGKTRLSIELTNFLINSRKYQLANQINILILVAKRVHKQTWEEELEKWGRINHAHGAKIAIHKECYESLHKHSGKHWDIILADEVHHIASDVRLDILKTISFRYFIGLSATIPQKLQQLFRYRYHAQIVSCNITEAIDSDILPEPQILLFPLVLDNRNPTESWEYFPNAPGRIIYDEYRNIRKYKYNKRIHSIISMTQKQKCMEYDNLIQYFKKQCMATNSPAAKRSWLFHAGKRLEFLAEIKLPIIRDILDKLRNKRTITFCKTISQAEQAGRFCIHSKNTDAERFYQDFNAKKIDHITAVNILNENANLVDCQYGIFCNFSSSDISVPQRLGRLLRHKNPVIILPYYVETREEELVKTYIEGFTNVRTIYSIQEI